MRSSKNPRDDFAESVSNPSKIAKNNFAPVVMCRGLAEDFPDFASQCEEDLQRIFPNAASQCVEDLQRISQAL